MPLAKVHVLAFHLFEHTVAYNPPQGSQTLVDRAADRHSQRAGPVVPPAFAFERRVC
jgi:hypothetical protein